MLFGTLVQKPPPADLDQKVNNSPTSLNLLTPEASNDMAMTRNFRSINIRLSIETQYRIIDLVDNLHDLISLAHTCQSFRRHVLDIINYDQNLHTWILNSDSLIGTIQMYPMSLSAGSLNMNTLSLASFAASSSSDNDTLESTDTEESPTPEEDTFVFKITPDILKRVSHLTTSRSGASLPLLPAELQLQIFSYLDPIDSTCLGLSSPRSYSIYRAIYGTKLPLNTRRPGPNSLEAAWEVVGKQECAHCGMYRCELHQHIKSWMPKELEYCSMKRNFGIPADEEARANCYRGKPSKPRRCGRHPVRTTTIHQDDAHFGS